MKNLGHGKGYFRNIGATELSVTSQKIDFSRKIERIFSPTTFDPESHPTFAQSTWRHIFVAGIRNAGACRAEE